MKTNQAGSGKIWSNNHKKVGHRIQNEEYEMACSLRNKDNLTRKREQDRV